MIPIRHNTIFRSRWMALFWSAGIFWFAVDVAGGNDQPATNASANAMAAADAPLDPAEFQETQRLVRELDRK